MRPRCARFTSRVDVCLLVSHGSELALLFGPVPEVETDFANQMLDFYINFINDLNPGAPWPQYTSQTKQVLQLMRNNVTAIPDGTCRTQIPVAYAPRLMVSQTSLRTGRTSLIRRPSWHRCRSKGQDTNTGTRCM